MHVLQYLGHKVMLPMLSEMDNKEAVNYANNWNVSEHARYINVKQYFHKLKEEGFTQLELLLGEAMRQNIVKEIFYDLYQRNNYESTMK